MNEEIFYLKRSKLKEYWPWHPHLFNHWYVDGFYNFNLPDEFRMTTWKSRLGPLYPLDPNDCTTTSEFPDSARLPDGWDSCTKHLYSRHVSISGPNTPRFKLTFKRLAAVSQLWGHVMRNNSLHEFLNIRWPDNLAEAAALEEARFSHFQPKDSVKVEFSSNKPFFLRMAEFRVPLPVQTYFNASGSGLRELPFDLFEPV